ncbi:MAG: hypothetical protein IKV46_04500 [Bacteroidales bacterium]|nr:hypothetical protein [Bacteroidales bacterium]
MKRSIILLLVLLPIFAFSQMQHIISQGNTATTQRLTRYHSTIDSNLIRIRSVNSNELIISMPDNNGLRTVFSISTIGTISTPLAYLDSVKVYDFKLFGGDIYFCGESNFYGSFIGWTTINNLFSTNPSPITLQLINNPIKPKAVTELEVYKWNDGIHVVALADEVCLIDMNTSSPSTYQIMGGTSNKLKKLSIGDKKIVTLGSINDTTIAITAFDKGNISQYIYECFSHPELRHNKYVLENSMINEDIFTFGYTHREYTSNNYYKTDFATFEVTNGINIINKQYLEIPDGKLEPIDLEYCPEDSTLLYLAGGYYGYDEIFPIKHLIYGDYVVNSIQPDYLISNPIKQYNSIIRYENYYFAAFAKDTPSSRGLIFDCKRNSSSFLNCASSHVVKVINDFFLNPIPYNVTYQYDVGYQDTITINLYMNASLNAILCQ